MSGHYWTMRGWHDWEPLYNRKARWNWIDFAFIHLSVEAANYDSPHEVEIHVGLLGFHVEIIRVNRAKVAMWDERIEALRASRSETPGKETT